MIIRPTFQIFKLMYHINIPVIPIKANSATSQVLGCIKFFTTVFTLKIEFISFGSDYTEMNSDQVIQGQIYLHHNLYYITSINHLFPPIFPLKFKIINTNTFKFCLSIKIIIIIIIVPCVTK